MWIKSANWKRLSELGGIEALLTQLLPICFTLVYDGLLDAVPGEELGGDIDDNDKKSNKSIWPFPSI